MNILYITFGNSIDNHLQASFSIFSFLNANNKGVSISIYTDAPHFYSHLKNRAAITEISQEQLNAWKGEYGFFWRIKIKAIQQFAAQHAGQFIMYLDTDTILFHDLEILSTYLAEGSALMHTDEGKLSEMKGKTPAKMWIELKDKNFAGLQINSQYGMWNAGVVASPNTKGGEEFSLALKLCDEMCAANIRQRLLEQFALSVALEHSYGLKAAECSIAHYWSNKSEWNDFIKNFLLTGFFQQKVFDQLAEDFKKLDLSAIPIYKKVKTTSSKLHKLVNQFFKEENITYLPSKKQ